MQGGARGAPSGGPGAACRAESAGLVAGASAQCLGTGSEGLRGARGEGAPDTYGGERAHEPPACGPEETAARGARLERGASGAAGPGGARRAPARPERGAQGPLARGLRRRRGAA